MNVSKPNRLMNEKSPYLLQHAHNPVDWYPWSEEAFEKARSEDKPIFLSIGYSTCHWCHVMEDESFTDKEIAGLLNKNYVSIKIDREERPDIDSVYMSVCQALTGSGGWPLTIITDAEKAPFYAATYLPKHSRYGVVGLYELLSAVTEAWQKDKSRLLKTGEEIKAFLRKEPAAGVKKQLDKAILNKAVKDYEISFDRVYGGFGEAPKFPSPHNLLFLLSYYEKERGKNKEAAQTALKMAEKTLQGMYKGGIFDHIGGGFSRYSTDEAWLAPHFEKMLYDNALMTLTYSNAYRITGNKLYKAVAERVLGYISKELTHDNGGFYCGQDADSDGEEGKYYVFGKDEIMSVLGKEEGEKFCAVYGITDKGNFEGKNIPNLLHIKNEIPLNLISEKTLKKLYSYRLDRARLHKDDKILTSWNGLMITAYSFAYTVFGDKEYLDAAVKAEAFISEKLTDGNRLTVRYRDGNSAGKGTLDDYAFYILGLLELYNACFNASYLEKAKIYAEAMTEHFFDKKNGGFFLYADDAEKLITRPKETYDGAVPSGNSAAVVLLDKLSRLTGEIKWREYLDKQLEFMSGAINLYPVGYGFALFGLCGILHERQELVCLLSEPFDYGVLNGAFRKNPDLSVIVKTRENSELLEKTSPFTKAYRPENNGGNLFYLCAENACMPPVKDFGELSI